MCTGGRCAKEDFYWYAYIGFGGTSVFTCVSGVCVGVVFFFRLFVLLLLLVLSLFFSFLLYSYFFTFLYLFYLLLVRWMAVWLAVLIASQNKGGPGQIQVPLVCVGVGVGCRGCPKKDPCIILLRVSFGGNRRLNPNKYITCRVW